MNTNVNIHAPLGVRSDTSSEKMNVVKVVVRDDMNEEATSFMICLTPGDSWTATLSMDGLMVGDSGNCDGDVYLGSETARSGQDASPPMSGALVSLGEATSGYLEAWLAPRDALVEDDEDTAAVNMHAAVMPISGTAMLVSPMAGFSSSYNATALMDCVDNDDIDSDDGDGCWNNDDSSTATDDNGGLISSALMSGNELLVGRWTAIDDMNVTSHTKLVLTFPVNHLNYDAKNDDGDDVTETDPVSVYAFNDAGEMTLQGEAMLGKNTNMCMFDMNMLSCNGMMVDELGGTMAGGFRIFNNTVSNVPTSDDTNTEADDRIPTDDNDGSELEDLGNGRDAKGNFDANADRGQIPAEGLGAIGLVCSYFMGTNGMNYDQITPIQSIDAGDDGSNL